MIFARLVDSMKHTTFRCYLCRSTTNLTKDHVPPKNLFPKPRPKNLITVPCCRTCNESFSKADERFRAFVATPVNSSPAGKQILKEKVIGSTFKRSPAFKSQFKAGVSLAQIETELGATNVSLIVDDQASLGPVLVRITKGLLATFYPALEYDGYEFSVTQLNQFGAAHPSFGLATAQFLYDEMGNRVFQFWRGLATAPDGTIAGIWIYQFYGAALFMVTHDVPSKCNMAVAPASPIE